jgi:GrpB-like predicted nucleotidyltransferase (UPF0157 family)
MPENDKYKMEDRLREITIGEPTRINGQIALEDYNPEWPRIFAALAEEIRAGLGDRALALEHVGSTSVYGLASKPVIDIHLVVADSSDEPAYVPPLERIGYVLRIREPKWHRHRLLERHNPEVNLHAFPENCRETGRVLLFRDWLRMNDGDRLLYENTKRSLASRTWSYVQEYAEAKSEVVEAILARARAAKLKT